MILMQSTKSSRVIWFCMSALITESTWWDSATADASNSDMKSVALTRVVCLCSGMRHGKEEDHAGLSWT